MQVKGKRIVITGGTSGIGYETVRQTWLDNEVIVIARDATRLDTLKGEFDTITTFQADLSRLRETEEVAKGILQRFETLDVLINNAAVQNTPMFLDSDFHYETIEKEITLNFTSVCALTSLLLPALLHDQSAAILNVNSGLGLTPKTSSAIYCATKGAMNLFSQSLRYQLEATNIKVLQAFMPLVNTPMTEGRGSGKISAAKAARLLLKGLEKEIPDHDIGMTKLLRKLLRWSPSLAQRLMKRG